MVAKNNAENRIKFLDKLNLLVKLGSYLLNITEYNNMKKLLFLIFLFTLEMNAYAQNTTVVGVSNININQSITEISSGEYITFGWKYICRWDTLFNLKWSIKLDDTTLTNSSILPQRLIEAQDGNLYYQLASNQYTSSVTVIKISPNGSVLWQRNYHRTGSLFNIGSISKAISGDNGFIMGFQAGCNTSPAIIKCDQNGNVEWAKNYRTTNPVTSVYPRDIITNKHSYAFIADSGPTIVAMQIDSIGTILSSGFNKFSGRYALTDEIIKMDSSNTYAVQGTFKMYPQKRFLAIYDSSMQMIKATELRNYAILTSVYSRYMVYDIEPAKDGNNILIVGNIIDPSISAAAICMKVSQSGNILWQKKMGLKSNTFFNSGVGFSGVINSNNSIILSGYGGNEGSIFAKIDQQGNGLCDALDLNSTDSTLSPMIVATTLTSTNVQIYSSNISLNYNHNFSRKRYTYCGDIIYSIQKNTINNTINIYPNPAKNEFTINCKNQKPISLKIYSISGKVLIDKKIENNKEKVTIDFLKDGFYILKLFYNNGEVSAHSIIKS